MRDSRAARSRETRGRCTCSLLASRVAGHNKDVDGPTPLIKRDALLGLIDRSAPAQAHVHTVPRERLRARTGDVVEAAAHGDGEVDVNLDDLNVDLDHLELAYRGTERDHREPGHLDLDSLDLHKRYIDNLELENRYIDHRELESRDLDHDDLGEDRDLAARDLGRRDIADRDHRDAAQVDPLRAREAYQDLDEEIGPSVSPLLVLGVIALLIVTFIAATQLR